MHGVGAGEADNSVHHRRHQPHPQNARIAVIRDTLPEGSGGFVAAGPVKAFGNHASLAIWDFRLGGPFTEHALPEIIPGGDPRAVGNPGTNPANPLPCFGHSHHVLSDVSNAVSNSNVALGFAYVTGRQWIGDHSDGGIDTPSTPMCLDPLTGTPMTPSGPSSLVIVDVSNALQQSTPANQPSGAFPNLVYTLNVQEPHVSFSPYATRVTIWPERAPGDAPLGSGEQ